MVNPDLVGRALLGRSLPLITHISDSLLASCLSQLVVTLWFGFTKSSITLSLGVGDPITTGTISKWERTGVGAGNVAVATFPSSIGIATRGIRVATNPGARGLVALNIQSTEGEIQVPHLEYRPSYTIIPNNKSSKPKTKQVPVPTGYGICGKANVAARCLRNGKLESGTIPLEESILSMEAIDKVREIGGSRYPEKVESTYY